MRRSLLVILMLLLACSFAYGADHIQLATYTDGDVAYQNQTAVWNFNITRECPSPAMIMGASNGFALNATGPVTFEYNVGSFAGDAAASGWFNLGGLLFTDYFTAGQNNFGEFLTGGAAMPPGGMPITTDHAYFALTLTYGPGFGGTICIDSAFVGAAGAWKFSGLTCGQGGAPDRPLFVDAAYNVGPVCIDIEELICQDPDITNCPTMAVTGNHCNAVTYAFTADPGMDGLNPATIASWDVTSGEGGINSAGEYSVGPLPTGTYPVEVTVTNSCNGTDVCNFNVTFTNNAPAITNCPTGNIIIGRPNTAA